MSILGRISAGYSVEGAVRECVAGIRYFHWLKGVERDFDARFQRLQTELFALCRRIFTSGRLTIGFTGGSGGALHALEEKLLALLPSSDRRERACTVKPWGRRREGIVIPTDTSFAVLGGSLLRCGAPYSGTAEVMSGVLSLVHLWNEVRVQGGAYGTAVRQGPAGNACFHSYRDPDPARSLGCFRRSADFLREFCAAKPDLTGFIIGEISASTPLLLPRQQGKMADSFYLRGVTYEERCRTWHEMLSASSEALSALAAPLQELQETGSVCVVSPLQQLETCGADIESLVTL